MTNTMHPLTAKQIIISLHTSEIDETTDLSSFLSARRRGNDIDARYLNDAIDALGEAECVAILRKEIKAMAKRRARWAKAAAADSAKAAAYFAARKAV